MEYDPRTLYDRLQDQKNKKQEEYEETHKLKNLIRGLDNDELSFLELVDKNKIDEAEKKLKEESDALDEYKQAITDLTDEEQVKKIADFKKSLWSASKAETSKKPLAKKSQAALLANVVKRKSDSSRVSGNEPAPKKLTLVPPVNVVQCIGVLPGLGAYGSDSDDSDNSTDSENDDELQGLFLLPRVAREQSECNDK